ncbi:MAG: hypothetical protein ACTSSI_16960 [Candidatus Helarchaeota archaeon]
MTDTKVKIINFHSEEFVVLAETCPSFFKAYSQKDKEEADRWLKEHPNTLVKSIFHPYIQHKLLVQE